ncbi:glycosyltransferase family 1 protein [Massilimicrobiota timonensis]|uniref:glycosyltransferase family 1 protein n=1 Tax=Massilimicrobiota timonensis TaxID=1776392 RepID=UPI00101BB2D7|nr:glycosyltransferase family 1 protein [Massilimicrobiota timonensis]
MCQNEKAERILVIIPGLNVCGGMESFFMNYFRNIDRSKIVFDFLTHDISDVSYVKEIQELGGNIYRLPPFSIGNLKLIKVEYINILKENHYRIVHCNMANAAFMYLNIAKKMNIPIRILHSHQDKAADSFSHALRNIPLIYYGKKFANVRIACSKQAGDYLFKTKEYTIINNAIDYSKFKYNQEIRANIRKKININHNYVVGNTGRLAIQKNQRFLIDIFYEIKKKKENAYLLLVGEGEERKSLEEKVIDLSLEDSVLFLGSRSDISELLSAMDVFVFPSLYEGLGISILEAQAASLMCFCSKNVPKEADISGNIEYISLDLSAKEWADIILMNDSTKLIRQQDIMLSKEYDIKEKCSQLTYLYYSYLKEFDKQ